MEDSRSQPLILVLLAVGACHASNDALRDDAGLHQRDAADAGQPPIIHNSVGISEWWTNELRGARGGSAVFAVIVGLSDVERLDLSGATVQVTKLPKPANASGKCAHAAPVGLVPVDVDQNGAVDIVVHDLCGSYVVWDAETDRPSASEEVPATTTSKLPGDGPFERIDVSPDERSTDELATGNRHGRRAEFLRDFGHDAATVVDRATIPAQAIRWRGGIAPRCASDRC